MASLKAVAEAIGQSTIELPGIGKVPVRFIPVRVLEAIEMAIEEPMAPRTLKAPGGSLAPMLPNEQDPTFRRQFDQYLNRLLAAQVAWVLTSGGVQLVAGSAPRQDAPEFRAWALAAANELLDMLPRQMLSDIHSEFANLGSAKRLAAQAEALGNSSSQPTA